MSRWQQILTSPHSRFVRSLPIYLGMWLICSRNHGVECVKWGSKKQDIEWTKVSRLLKFWVGATALRIFIDKLLALCLLEHIIYSIVLRLDPFSGANHCSDTISSASTAQLDPYLDRAPRTHTSTGYSPSPSPASRQALHIHVGMRRAACLILHPRRSVGFRRLH